MISTPEIIEEVLESEPGENLPLLRIGFRELGLYSLAYFLEYSNESKELGD